MSDDERLREQLAAVRDMAETVRQKCYENGALVAVVKGKDGRPITNPYLVEWHRLMDEARALAADLGADEEAADETGGKLVEATRNGEVTTQLEELTVQLAEEIERTTGHGKAALCRVYLDALRELRQIRGEATPVDRIAEIQNRTGHPNARRLSVI